jgi:hypothetical protein
MYYFILNKFLEGNCLYKIAENESDLNNLILNNTDYKIINVDELSFLNIKYNIKSFKKIENDIITYDDITQNFNKDFLINYISYFKRDIQNFINANPNHVLLERWKNYYNQLNSLNIDDINYPLTKSLEKYFNDLGQPSYNILQLP